MWLGQSTGDLFLNWLSARLSEGHRCPKIDSSHFSFSLFPREVAQGYPFGCKEGLH